MRDTQTNAREDRESYLGIVRSQLYFLDVHHGGAVSLEPTIENATWRCAVFPRCTPSTAPTYVPVPSIRTVTIWS